MANEKYGAAALPKEISDKYELVDWVGGHRQNFGSFGDIDLSQLTEQQVERLISKGFKKIRKKSKAAAAAGESTAKK